MLKLIRTLRKFSQKNLPPRQSMQYDVAIVGAGPAGLSTAIRLKQLCPGSDLSVCILQKGSAVGNHILSGNCFQPSAFQMLYPNWRTMQNRPPLKTIVKQDEFAILTQKSGFKIPQKLIPLNNKGNYLISLGKLCSWMAQRAQAQGIDIFAQAAADQLLYDQTDKVVGIATKDRGINKKGQIKDNFQRGIQIRAKQVVLAQGCRGSLSQQAIKKYNLRQQCDMQTYGIGLKQVWQVPQQVHRRGLAFHSVGYPLSSELYGGSFIYHMQQNLVHFGMVIGLDYKNPLFNPYQQFQRLKTHPIIQSHLKGGRCISYGARALNQGGYFAIPKLAFPGGLMVGCSAGFLNVMKIKGSHNAIRSGIIAAQNIVPHIKQSKSGLIQSYEKALKQSQIYKELYQSRNFKGGFKNGLWGGLLHGGLVSMVTKGKQFWNLKNQKVKDADTYTVPRKQQKEKSAATGPYVRKLLDNLALSGTNHNHDQPSHLVIKKGYQNSPKKSINQFQGPQQRFCPAKVYEYIDGQLVINAQNCLHCKTCSIKMPEQYIEWKVPQSGGGPKYSGM